MRWRLFLITFLFLIVATSLIYAQQNTTITGQSITGEAVTGKATQQTSVKVNVVGSQLASITINKPENKTYLTNTSIWLDFTANNYQAIWYKLDNQNNKTINSNTYFNASQGSHTLILYANNSLGNMTSKNVTFSVNTTLYTINYSYFNGSNKGNSTDFTSYSLEELENFSNCTFENTNYGKILFTNTLNLTGNSGSTLDFNKYVNISSNWIEINTSALPNLNSSATLTLYDLDYSDPRIIINGIVCPTDVCVKNSYSGGDLNFNVSHFTAFTAEETPSSPSNSPSVSSSFGGSGSIKKSPEIGVNSMEITPDKFIKILIKQKEKKQESFTIKNTGTINLNINLLIQGIDAFTKINEKSFTLAPGETKKVNLEFNGLENKDPNVYTGRILIHGNNLEKAIPVILELESKKPLFDINIKIPEGYSYVKSGQNIPFNVKLLELEELSKVDVNMEYNIKNEEGTTITSSSETIGVEKQADFTKTLTIPENIPKGNYLVYVRVLYSGEVASASESFTVGKKPFTVSQILIYLLIFLLLISVTYTLYQIRKLKKSIMSNKGKVSDLKIMKINKRGLKWH